MKTQNSTRKPAPVLPQQEADFTSEGAPPPGHVGVRLPVDAVKDTAPRGTSDDRSVPKDADPDRARGD